MLSRGIREINLSRYAPSSEKKVKNKGKVALRRKPAATFHPSKEKHRENFLPLGKKVAPCRHEIHYFSSLRCLFLTFSSLCYSLLLFFSSPFTSLFRIAFHSLFLPSLHFVSCSTLFSLPARCFSFDIFCFFTDGSKKKLLEDENDGSKKKLLEDETDGSKKKLLEDETQTQQCRSEKQEDRAKKEMNHASEERSTK